MSTSRLSRWAHALSSVFPSETRHASAVAFDGRGVLILGQAGAGKSALSLELIACGGTLVSDDRVILSSEDARVMAAAPDAIEGMIEARFVGILKAQAAPAEIVLVIDLDKTESDRLPPKRHIAILGQRLPLLHKAESRHFAPAIRQYLLYGSCS